MAAAQASYGSLPFKEQIAFFRRKQNLTTDSWTSIWNEEHDKAFVVAGANRDDLVADFRDAIDRAICEGGTLEDFREDFDGIVAKHGWSYNGGRNWRSRVIYETNLRSSYAAGRYVQLQAVKSVRPYWRYRHSDSVMHPRPLHLAWNGLVLHADDPWWQQHYPPNGWGCQCTVEALNQRDLASLGKSGPDTAPPIVMQTDTVGIRGPDPRRVETPRGVDPGFGYQPGASVFGDQVADAISKTARLPAPWAAQSAEATLAVDTAANALDARFSHWLDRVLDDPKPRGRTQIVGALSPDVVRALEARGITPATAAIILRDQDALHALRVAKQQAVTAAGEPKGLTADEYRQLPVILRSPKAVLLDAHGQALYYLYDAGRRGAGKVVVKINYKVKGADQPINLVRTASLIGEGDMASQAKSGDMLWLQGAPDE